MWDYDKLFDIGNIVAVKNYKSNCVCWHGVNDTTDMKSFNEYHNDKLCWDGWYIQYIVQLDEHGDVVEKLFDRAKDMKKEPMPDLEDGYFIDVDSPTGGLGIVLDKIVTYQNGGYAYVINIKNKITKVWSYEIASFNECKNEPPMWERN